MNNLAKKGLMYLCICCKPRVFATLSILMASSYINLLFARNFNSHHSLDKRWIICICFLVLISFFFANVAKYAIIYEIPTVQNLLQNSRRGFRFVPVVFIHLLFISIFEYAAYQFIKSPLSKDTFFGPRKRWDQQLPISQYHATFISTMIISATIYSIVYNFFELVVSLMFDNQNLVDAIHRCCVTCIVRISGIDISDNPTGEAVDNPLERTLMGAFRRIDDTPPTMAEYAATEIHQEAEKDYKKRNAVYNSWNTLR